MNREEEKRLIYNQYLNEEKARRLAEQKRAGYIQMPKSIYGAAKSIGQTGKLMSQSSNPNIAKLGSNMYKYSGQEGIDNVKTGFVDKFNSLTSPINTNASTNTIANFASPNMSATPTISNPATTNLATEFGGATTPTLSNATTGTTLGNFGTQGATALNGAATSASSPLTTAIASEASGAGLGAANAGLGALGTEAATTAGAGTLAGAGTATAGTGAALGGAGAAGTGAAAGLIGAAGAAMPILGAAMLGYQIYDMIAGAKKKKNQEAIEKDQQAMAQNEQLANETTNQAMQNLSNSSAQKRQELLNEVVNPQQQTGYVGQLPNLYNQQADTTTPQNYIPEQIAQTQESTTGGAAPIQTEPIVDQSQGIQTGQIDATQDNKGLKDNLMSFFGDIGGGFKENNTNTISPSNFFDNTYTTQQTRVLPHDEQVGAFADKLKQDGVKEDVINAYLTEGKNSGNKEIANWVNAHKDLQNEDGTWKPVTKTEDVEKKKGIGYRVGEALGTANRIASNPATQGLASTAFWLKDGQPLGYALGKGLEYGANKARSDAYRKLVNGDNSASVFGGYSEKDLNALTNQEYKRIMAEISKGRLGETTRHNQVTEGQKDRQLDMNYELGKERNAIMLKNSKTMAARLTEAIRHNKVSEYISQQRINNNSKYDTQEFNSNLVKYANLLGNPNATSEQKTKARRGMIENYGKDFINIEKKLENGDL